jgi:hypothetical protein
LYETNLLEFAAYYTRSVDGLMDIDLGPNPGLRGAVWKHEEAVTQKGTCKQRKKQKKIR